MVVNATISLIPNNTILRKISETPNNSTETINVVNKMFNVVVMMFNFVFRVQIYIALFNTSKLLR